MGPRTVRIGVLALQGAFREHINMLDQLHGVEAVEVRTVDQLASVDGLILPGGESTTMALIAERWGLIPKLKELVKEGLPMWGTCAGLILLADKVEGQRAGGQMVLGGLDVVVHRNFFGAQIESFECELPAPECLHKYGSDPVRAVFIRAPAVLSAGPGVSVISELSLTNEQQEAAHRATVAIAVQSNNILATAFHPELAGDTRWTRLFVSMVEEHSVVQDRPAVNIPGVDSKLGNPPGLPIFGEEHIFAG